MKERPILFSGPMVRAILEGRKTQTRRVVKPQPFMVLSAADWHSRAMSGVDPYGCRPMGSHVLEEMGATCPHGTVGDRLWVREAWGLWDTLPNDGPERARIFYRSTDSDLHECRHQLWRPSIHMPRWASRITLEITGVRVERLQEISDADCRAEGCCHRSWNVTDWKHPHHECDWSIERGNFASLWSSINGPESWSANPWVWVIEFKRLETT